MPQIADLNQRIRDLHAALLSNLIEQGAATPEDIVLYEVSQGRGTWDGLIAALRYAKVVPASKSAGDVLSDVLAVLSDKGRIKLASAQGARRFYREAA